MKPEMKVSRLPRLPLRARFALGAAAVALPFLLATGVGQFYLLPRLLEPLEMIVHEVTEEMRPAVELEIALHKVSYTGPNYLVLGTRVAREAFERSIRRVEEAFAATSMDQLLAKREREREFFLAARGEWQQAQGPLKALLRPPEPSGNLATLRDMESLEDRIGRAIQIIEKMQVYLFAEVRKDQALAQAAIRQEKLLITVALVTALGIALAAEALIARYVLGFVDALRRALRRVEEGDLTARVASEANDEFGELAFGFNAMTEKIETYQRALEELAIRDGLTGLANRREFDRRLKEELERSRRYSRPSSLLMLDLDHFKAVNDIYGHPAGDEVLRTLAARMREQVRPVDHVARYGGEEFAAILPETDGSGALALAERLRRAIAAVPFALDVERSIDLTASIGVASFPRDGETERDLTAAADHALYRAKQSGRNRVSSRTDG